MMVEKKFPGLVARLDQCETHMRDTYGIKPHFGRYWNFCINAPRSFQPASFDKPEKLLTGPKTVVCDPHLDRMNLALMICVLFIYGELLPSTLISLICCVGFFDSKTKFWLVIWELGIIIELPAGVFLAYPSSIFFHWTVGELRLAVNVLRFDWLIEFLYTEDGESPTKSNSKPVPNCSEGEVRGSLVWFNQGTMYQTSELLYDTVKKAKKAGIDTKCTKDASTLFPSRVDEPERSVSS